MAHKLDVHTHGNCHEKLHGIDGHGDLWHVQNKISIIYLLVMFKEVQIQIQILGKHFVYFVCAFFCTCLSSRL